MVIQDFYVKKKTYFLQDFSIQTRDFLDWIVTSLGIIEQYILEALVKLVNA